MGGFDSRRDLYKIKRGEQVKNKLITLLALTLVFVSLYNVQVNAASFQEQWAYIAIGYNGSVYSIALASSDQTVTYDGNVFTWQSPRSMYYATTGIYSSTIKTFTNIGDAISYLETTTYHSSGAISNQRQLITIKGKTFLAGNVSPPDGDFYGTYGEYQESLIPKWYENAWDTFVDYFTNPIPFQWFKNLIDRVFSDDNEGTISDNVNLTNPTLTPPPTPIPYSTVVIPKTDINTGETYYETNYIYANPSGTPIVQPYPPTSAPTSGSRSSDNSYYPVDGEPLKLPKLNWLSPVTIGDSNYDGIDSIYDGLSSVDDIGSEYKDGLSAVSDATSVLPTNWLMLIGIAAAIPLIAGIISRFLS